MRTTLNIDDDVLEAAKALAVLRKTTPGRVISDLAREALTQPAEGEPEYRGGFRLLPRTGQIVTPDLVQKLLEEDD